MNRTVTIAPVRKSIRVNANQAHAFEVFTSGLGRWWPRTHTIGKPPMQTAVLEPRLGGRWYELSEDGSQAERRAQSQHAHADAQRGRLRAVGVERDCAIPGVEAAGQRPAAARRAAAARR